MPVSAGSAWAAADGNVRTPSEPSSAFTTLHDQLIDEVGPVNVDYFPHDIKVTELTRKVKKWRKGWDSNPRRTRCLARLATECLKPTQPPFQYVCGGRGGIRTHGGRNASLRFQRSTLSQLSHPTSVIRRSLSFVRTASPGNLTEAATGRTAWRRCPLSPNSISGHVPRRTEWPYATFLPLGEAAKSRLCAYP